MNQPDILQDSRERNDFFIALGVIALALIFVLTNTFGTDIVSVSAEESIEDSPVSIEAIPYHIDEESDLKRTTTKTDDRPHTKKVINHAAHYKAPSDLPAISQTYMPALTDGDLDIVDTTITTVHLVERTDSSITHMMESTEDSSIDVSTQSDTNISSEALSDQPDQVTSPDDNTLESDVADTEEICHISVGLFKDDNNIRRLVSRLENRGFDVYTKSFPRSTQVGIYITCQRTLAESILSEIQTMYAKDAFIEEF